MAGRSRRPVTAADRRRQAEQREAKLAALHERLHAEVTALRSGEDWTRWLDVARRFHRPGASPPPRDPDLLKKVLGLASSYTQPVAVNVQGAGGACSGQWGPRRCHRRHPHLHQVPHLRRHLRQPPSRRRPRRGPRLPAVRQRLDRRHPRRPRHRAAMANRHLDRQQPRRHRKRLVRRPPRLHPLLRRPARRLAAHRGTGQRPEPHHRPHEPHPRQLAALVRAGRPRHLLPRHQLQLPAGVDPRTAPRRGRPRGATRPSPTPAPFAPIARDTPPGIPHSGGTSGTINMCPPSQVGSAAGTSVPMWLSKPEYPSTSERRPSVRPLRSGSPWAPTSNSSCCATNLMTAAGPRGPQTSSPSTRSFPTRRNCSPMPTRLPRSCS